MEFICDPSGFYETPQQSTLANPASWLVEALTYGRDSDTGVTVNWKSAVGLSAAFYCINTISSVIGQTPLCLYERKPDKTTEEDRTHLAGKVIRNPQRGAIGAFHFRNLLQNHALTEGNGRAFIVRNGRDEPEAFVPLPAERTTTVLLYDNETQVKQKWHVVFPETGEPIPLPDEDVLHIYRFSRDGYSGVPVLDLLKNTFGLGIANERAAAKFFKQGGIPSMILEAPTGALGLRDESKAKQFIDDFNKYHAGLDNAQRVALLREGIQAKVLGINNRDAQMLEQRDFSVRDIMRVFGMTTIPGVETTQAGYNGLEQLNRSNLIHCFGPWMKIWEEECGRKLLTPREIRMESYYFMFDTWELVKPDANAEADMLQKYVSGMILEANEARDVLGYPPHKDGKGLKNPNTTKGPDTGKPQPEPDDPPPAPEPEPQPDSGRLRRATAAAIRPVISAEINRVRTMAGTARDYIAWMHSYYAKQQSTLEELIESLGGDAELAIQHVTYSKSALTAIVSQCDKADLKDRVETVTAAWLSRADELAATITGAGP